MTDDYSGPDRRRVRDGFRARLARLDPSDQLMLATAVASLFVILGVLTFGIINTNQKAADGLLEVQRAAQCITYQLAEHRVNTAQHNTDVAAAHGYAGTDPDEPPSPPSFAAIREACRGFLDVSDLERLAPSPGAEPSTEPSADADRQPGAETVVVVPQQQDGECADERRPGRDPSSTSTTTTSTTTSTTSTTSTTAPPCSTPRILGQCPVQ